MNKVFLFLLVIAIATAQIAFAQPAFAAAKAPASKTVKKTAPASKPASKPKQAKTAPAKPAEAEAPKKDPVANLEESVSSIVAPEPEPEPEPEAQKADNDSNEEETSKAESSEDDDDSAETAKSKKSGDGDEIRFGIRANFTVPRVFPGTIVMNSNEKEIFMDGGVGGGLSGFLVIPISSFHFVPELSVQYRKPINIDNPEALPKGTLAITEIAIEIPLMFRFLYSEDNLIYLGVGLFGGVVLDVTEEPPSDHDGIKQFRSLGSPDYGLVLELGFRINENFSIDVRGTASAAPYGIGEYLNSGDTPRLLQAQLGVNYTF